MAGFDHQEIEKRVQEKWAEMRLYETDLADQSRDPYYVLFEFPYPSGDLHIGHWYAFALTDIFARYKRLTGKNVLFPMGFDSFGLPAENAAIKRGIDPRIWTYENMDRMRDQVRSMGTSVDWSKEVATSDPSFYKWTQWLFLKLYAHGLAERKEAPVKWCPKDQTVLANEQVTDGACERCGTEVEEKRLTQWFLRITDYAERLLADLDPLPWREEIKDAQRAWIGKSEGAKITFPLTFKAYPEHNKFKDPDGNSGSITVFTTRPDTLYGATYIVLAPEHPWVRAIWDTEFDNAVTNKDQITKYVEAAKRKTERERQENKEKTGVKFEGIVAINPANGEEVPVYVADYVLGSYGTGAVMAVPAHDERDHEFAQKMELPIRTVIECDHLPYTGAGTLIDSGEFSGKPSDAAKWDIMEKVGGERTTNYRLRDWLVSRQRYWGCPIPVVYDPEGNPHAVASEHLPWLLPTDVDFTPNAEGSPLKTSKELRERVISLYGEGWTPEYDTLDTFVDSSWYFYRYLDPKDENDFSDMGLMKQWLPVDRYSGGSEHTTMHLLYARFFHKALYDLALVPNVEPFNERNNRGIILGPDGQKMSKSKGNVVNPDDMVEKYGADAVRLYLAFIGPYNEPGSYPWNLDGVFSMRKFLERIVRVAERVSDDESTLDLKRSLARATDKAGTDMERMKFNTAISALMVCLKDLEALNDVPRGALHDFLILLAPLAPHLAEHLYETTGGEGSIHARDWPTIDQELLKDELQTVIVQVASKKKGEIQLPEGASEADAIAAARAIPAIEALYAVGEPQRVIYVPGRILNLVFS
jgi:leucyl-tRNA synthetase